MLSIFNNLKKYLKNLYVLKHKRQSLKNLNKAIRLFFEDDIYYAVVSHFIESRKAYKIAKCLNDLYQDSYLDTNQQKILKKYLEDKNEAMSWILEYERIAKLNKRHVLSQFLKEEKDNEDNL